MPASDRDTVLDAFRLRTRRYVHLMGGGGKSALMYALARALVAEGWSVLTTTSTRIRIPGPAESSHVLVGADAAILLDRLRVEIAAHRHVTVAASRLEQEQKLRGFTVDQLDLLAAAGVADRLMVEADGAAGRSLKAHREHEPVLSPRADLVIVVIGVDCVGQPMDDRHVHRAALLRERLGRPRGAVVTAEDVAGICFHAEGYLGRIGADSEVLVFLNKAATPAATDTARAVATALERGDREHRIGGIVIGDVGTGSYLD